MTETICTVIVSMFFVFGLYSAGVQIKLLLYKLMRRISEIDKNKTNLSDLVIVLPYLLLFFAIACIL